MLACEGDDLVLFASQVLWFHAVGFGEHDAIENGSAVEGIDGGEVVVFYFDASIEQQDYALKCGAAAEIVEHQPLPVFLYLFGGHCVAIAGHVHEGQASTEVEEIQLLGAAGLGGDAGECVAAGKRIDQGRLADVGAAGEGDFRKAWRWELIEPLGGEKEVALGGEQQPPRLDGGETVGLGLFGGFFERICEKFGQDFTAGTRAALGAARRVRRMISVCWRMVSELFQLQ